MSVFKRRWYACGSCGTQMDAFAWDYDPHPEHCSVPMYESGYQGEVSHGVVQDTVDGHWCETLGHESVWIESKSQLRAEAEKRGLVNVVRHDDAYYARQRKRHDEELRDTGTNREY